MCLQDWQCDLPLKDLPPDNLSAAALAKLPNTAPIINPKTAVTIGYGIRPKFVPISYLAISPPPSFAIFEAYIVDSKVAFISQPVASAL